VDSSDVLKTDFPMKNCLTTAFALFLGGAALAAATPAKPPHILLICIDDLRPELGCYGAMPVKSPAIDKLATEAVLFARAYCQVPVCGAARASFLSGLRPTPTRFLKADSSVAKEAGTVVDLAATFLAAGYRTISNGKIHHDEKDRADSWSEIYRPADYLDYHTPANQERMRTLKQAESYEAPEVPDNVLQGGLLADKVIADLRAAKASAQPHLITAGFTKPHLPFIAPKKYWDLYRPEDIKLATNPRPPQDAPKESLHNSAELRIYYTDIPDQGPISEEKQRTLVHGYYACVSFTDAMVGRILDEIDRLGMREEVIVVLMGDHGWQLGEHGLWVKHCNYETSLHAPLLMRAPGLAQGRRAEGLVEYLDIYPTLCDLTGVPAPQHLQGTSLRPQLTHPDAAGKKYVHARFRSGDTVITERYFYTEYLKGGAIGARMLYDHATDPEENFNVAADPARAAVVAELSAELARHRAEFYR
jgi:iduronate 2-sulfatase